MLSKAKIKNVLEILQLAYPDAKPQLEYTTAYELLIAVMLSAQCTDIRVNKVTKKLFEKYNTPQAMVTLTEEQLEGYIFSCGLYHSKARHILSASRDIIDNFSGQIPSSVELLRTLAGVGRKTANVVYSVALNGDAIAVDTHVFRVSNRIGLASSSSVLTTEKQLMQNIPKQLWSKSHHYLIYHGRQVCKSQNPACDLCQLNKLCQKNNKRGK